LNTPLAPDEIFPAGSSDIVQRFLTLRSGVRVRIAESGPRDGTPVVMLPGWGGTVYMYRHGFDALSRAGLRVIAADLRGFGLSDRPRKRRAYVLDSYIEDLLGLLDALELTNPLIVGQSMGGGVVLRFAQRHPERVSRIVLINPVGLVPLRFMPLLRMTPRFLSALGKSLVPRAMIRFILKYLAYGDPSLVTERDIDEYWAPSQLPGYVYAARATLSEFEWRPMSNDEAAGMAVPALVILGNRDRLINNTERAAKRLRDVTVHTLPGGHCAHEERPRQAYALIAGFATR
jgi:pimeloyl-ACP methyl ester carboxylesterase